MGLGVLATMLVLTALVAIHVLERMSPTVTEVVEQNVASLQASNEMLVALAAQRLPEHAALAARRRFPGALEAASRNQTEPAEAKPIVELRELSEAALAGEPQALEQALESVASLERANLGAMLVASADTLRLGKAGAWALALLGLLGFGVGGVVRWRLQRRVAGPLLELERVLLAADRGDGLQRCTQLGDKAGQRAQRALNRLLDSANREETRSGSTLLAPELVPWLLDLSGEPLALVDARGGLVSASSAALEMLSEEREGELPEQLKRAASGESEERVKVIRRSERYALLAIAAASGR